MSTKPKENPNIQIILSGRRPIRVVKAHWPIVASADWYSGQYKWQANEIAEIIVRQHEDGRHVVYGCRTDGPGGMSIGYRGAVSGYLVDSKDSHLLEKTILLVATEINTEHLGQRCINNLDVEDVI